MDQQETPSENKPEVPFNPVAEGLKLRQGMQQFQQEIQKLKAQTTEARLKTLKSIEVGIIKATQDGLHQTLFPNQPATIMTNPSDQEQNKPEGQPMTTGQDAMHYSDQHMSQIVNNIQQQINQKMQTSPQASTVEAAGMANIADAVASQASAGESAAQIDDTELDPNDVAISPEEEMQKAQQIVKDIVNPPAADSNKSEA